MTYPPTLARCQKRPCPEFARNAFLAADDVLGRYCAEHTPAAARIARTASTRPVVVAILPEPTVEDAEDATAWADANVATLHLLLRAGEVNAAAYIEACEIAAVAEIAYRGAVRARRFA